MRLIRWVMYDELGGGEGPWAYFSRRDGTPRPPYLARSTWALEVRAYR